MILSEQDRPLAVLRVGIHVPGQFRETALTMLSWLFIESTIC